MTYDSKQNLLDVNFDIVRLYKQLNFIDMDKLVSLHRNFHSDMVNNAMLWLKLRKLMKGMKIESIAHMASDFHTHSYELDQWLNMAAIGQSANFKELLFEYQPVSKIY